MGHRLRGQDVVSFVYTFLVFPLRHTHISYTFSMYHRGTSFQTFCVITCGQWGVCCVHQFFFLYYRKYIYIQLGITIEMFCVNSFKYFIRLSCFLRGFVAAIHYTSSIPTLNSTNETPSFLISFTP